MTSEGETRELVRHVAVEVMGSTLALVHPAIATPFEVKLIEVPGLVVKGNAPVRVAVKVTGASTVEETGELDVTARLVDAFVMVCGTAFDVACVKLLSAVMVAVIELEPASKVLVGQAAVKLESGTEPQLAITVVVPFSVVLKLTFPVGTIPVLGVTVTVNVTP